MIYRPLPARSAQAGLAEAAAGDERRIGERQDMADFLGLMKQATELKSKMEALQAELDHVEVEGTAGGGMVTVKMTAKGEVKSVHIDGSLMKPEDKEVTEDLIVRAIFLHNEDDVANLSMQCRERRAGPYMRRKAIVGIDGAA